MLPSSEGDSEEIADCDALSLFEKRVRQVWHLFLNLFFECIF